MNTSTVNYGSFIKTVLWVAVVSLVGNLILTVLGKMLSNPPTTFGPYMYSSVISLTLIGVVAAGIVYVAMRRFIADIAKANRWFIILSIIVLIASFYPDVALPWSTDSDQVGWTYGIMANLMLMHVVAGAAVVYYFTKKTA
jgi:hypothetical protein